MLLAAVGAGVCELRSTASELVFGVAWPVHAPVKFYAPVPPEVFLDSERIACEFDSSTGIGWVDLLVSPGQDVRIRSAQ